MQFTKATKHAAKLRLALVGPSGSGKTYTALAIATAMGGRIAVIDTEHGSASKYSDLFDFDTLQLEQFNPKNYIAAITAAENARYDILIIDSLSHAWNGTGGAMELVDKASERARGNSFAAWKDVTPLWNQMLDKIIRCKCHVIGTMRAKTEYVLEVGNNGKSTPKKHGMAPIFRAEGDYEFDVVGEISIEHTLTITKTRCPELADQAYRCAGADVAGILTEWLKGEPLPTPPRNGTERDYSGADLPPVSGAAFRESIMSDPLGVGDDSIAEIAAEKPDAYPGGCTVRQIKRLQTIATEMGWKTAEVKRLLKTTWGYDSSKDINPDNYDQICADLESKVLLNEIRAAIAETGVTV